MATLSVLGFTFEPRTHDPEYSRYWCERGHTAKPKATTRIHLCATSLSNHRRVWVFCWFAAAAAAVCAFHLRTQSKQAAAAGRFLFWTSAAIPSLVRGVCIISTVDIAELTSSRRCQGRVHTISREQVSGKLFKGNHPIQLAGGMFLSFFYYSKWSVQRSETVLRGVLGGKSWNAPLSKKIPLTSRKWYKQLGISGIWNSVVII